MHTQSYTQPLIAHWNMVRIGIVLTNKKKIIPKLRIIYIIILLERNITAGKLHITIFVRETYQSNSGSSTLSTICAIQEQYISLKGGLIYIKNHLVVNHEC